MKINVQLGGTKAFDQDLAVFFVTEDHEKDELKRLDGITNGIASTLVTQGLAKGKHGHAVVVPTFGKTPARMIGLVGRGTIEKYRFEKVRLLGGVIANQTKAHKVTSLAIDLDGATSKLEVLQAARAFVEGLLLGHYEFKEYKTENPEETTTLDRVVLVTNNEQKLSALKQAVIEAETEAAATIFARNLVNRPPSNMHPKILKETAEGIAHNSGGAITIKTYGRDKLKTMGAGGILGVGQGSEFEPFLVHMHYKPTGAKKSVALVGKGVTFDSGGYSIKSSHEMEDMKMDMAGAAVVLGVFTGLTSLRPDVEVHGVFATVENMVSDHSLRIGDIIKSMSGKTIEVLNTDAEGRIILADALFYAEQQKPDYMLDIATLTGACMVALGHEIAGILTKSEELAKTFLTIADVTGEKMCRLPMTEEYEDDVISDVADVQNMPKSRYGGAITAALFLQHFVKNTPWIHIDIAGPAFSRKSLNAYSPVGATGFGVRTILHWIQSL